MVFVKGRFYEDETYGIFSGAYSGTIAWECSLSGIFCDFSLGAGR
ncbi:MAG: hypothetical protein RHS_2084 [Robinsoniella sp. RHS]|nr:MAG: hypothetical protein RHS_2084 [Robinsoniella sp. RHS]